MVYRFKLDCCNMELCGIDYEDRKKDANSKDGDRNDTLYYSHIHTHTLLFRTIFQLYTFSRYHFRLNLFNRTIPFANETLTNLLKIALLTWKQFICAVNINYKLKRLPD